MSTGTLIGYCVLMPVVDEMHLLNLCVAPASQGRWRRPRALDEAVRIARTEKLDRHACSEVRAVESACGALV